MGLTESDFNAEEFLNPLIYRIVNDTTSQEWNLHLRWHQLHLAGGETVQYPELPDIIRLSSIILKAAYVAATELQDICAQLHPPIIIHSHLSLPSLDTSVLAMCFLINPVFTALATDSLLEHLDSGVRFHEQQFFLEKLIWVL